MQKILRDEWDGFCSRAACTEPHDAILQLLKRIYTTPPRAYHNLDHILDCLTALRELSADPPIAAELAIWFHDAVYIPGSTRNEAASAELCDAYAFALGFDDATRAEARTAIFATTHDAEPQTECARLVVDADLAILGAPHDKYGGYTRAIRREWSHIDDAAFSRGRMAFLERFLARDPLFATARGRDLFETSARTNLRVELESLRVQ